MEEEWLQLLNVLTEGEVLMITKLLFGTPLKMTYPSLDKAEIMEAQAIIRMQLVNPYILILLRMCLLVEELAPIKRFTIR